MNKFKYNIFKNLKSIPIKAEAFIIDIWGVLWDGIEVYDNAINCLQYLKYKNIPIILLSNAPRRTKNVIERLKKNGITPDLYNHVISSGEFCRQAFINKSIYTKNLGTNFFFLGLDFDKGLLDGLPYKETSLSDAHFVLLCGARDLSHKLNVYHDELNNIFELKLPLICVNPDKTIIRKDGELLICAGELANYYQSIGGSVISFGKPFKPIFTECLKKITTINPHIKPSNVFVIGDSLETDIQGANNAQIKSILITEGIHKNIFYPHLLVNDINLLFKKYKAIPDYILKTFSWD